MAKNLRTARILLSITAAFLAIVPLVADLNATHLANPLWPGHARLHTAWLLGTNSLVAVLALVLLWRRANELTRERVVLATTLLGCILLGFFFAVTTRSLYGGSLTDPNGVQTQVASIDANAFAFGLLSIIVGFVAWILRKPAS